MVEVAKAREAILFNRRREAEGKVKAHFENHPDSNIKALWKGATGTQSFVLGGTSLALAAENQKELTHLIRGEIRKYRGPSYASAMTIFDDSPVNEEIFSRYLRSKPQHYTEADRQAYPSSERREEELTVGKDVLRKLEDVMYFPDDDFKKSQREAAKLVAELSLTVSGQLEHTNQNLKGRIVIIDYLVNNVMNALVPDDTQSEFSISE